MAGSPYFQMQGPSAAAASLTLRLTSPSGMEIRIWAVSWWLPLTPRSRNLELWLAGPSAVPKMGAVAAVPTRPQERQSHCKTAVTSCEPLLKTQRQWKYMQVALQSVIFSVSIFKQVITAWKSLKGCRQFFSIFYIGLLGFGQLGPGTLFVSPPYKPSLAIKAGEACVIG